MFVYIVKQDGHNLICFIKMELAEQYIRIMRLKDAVIEPVLFYQQKERFDV